jgi:osmotically inducible protein OsmC
MPTSKASAEWNGGLKGGKGRHHAASGAFSGDYTFASRFESSGGTNPEELLAAAHASCFAMALSAGLEKSGHPPTSIKATAHCTLESPGGVPTITRMQLEVRGTVPGIDQAAFQQAADAAKDGCVVSRALKGNVEMILDAKLE